MLVISPQLCVKSEKRIVPASSAQIHNKTELYLEPEPACHGLITTKGTHNLASCRNGWSLQYGNAFLVECSLKREHVRVFRFN